MKGGGGLGRMLALEKQTLKWMQLTAFLGKNHFLKPSADKQENWNDHQKNSYS